MVKMRWMYYSLVFAMLLLVLALVWAKILFSDDYEKINISNKEQINITKTNSCIELNCPSDSIYVGSVNSDKYYACDCRYAKRVKPENIICFKTDDEAIAKNYTKADC